MERNPLRNKRDKSENLDVNQIKFIPGEIEDGNIDHELFSKEGHFEFGSFVPPKLLTEEYRQYEL